MFEPGNTICHSYNAIKIDTRLNKKSCQPEKTSMLNHLSRGFSDRISATS